MKKKISFLLSFIIAFGLFTNIFAKSSEEILNETISVVKTAVTNPKVGSVGGEWAVLGLARGNGAEQAYFDTYYSNVEKYTEENNGILHDKKYTEYSRVVLALTAIGKDPKNVAGFNLLTPLADFEKTVRQGINGPIWALIALDSASYEIPENKDAKIQATRELYTDYILNHQLADGGWALSGEESDPDITGMALQALAKYKDNENVKAAIDKALLCMSKKQDADGGFKSGDAKSSESTVQMLVALCELGIPLTDSRFVKGEKTLFDALMGFYVEGGGFSHITDENSINLMATEQALYALVALSRFEKGENSLYDMSAVKVVGEDAVNSQTVGLPGKIPDVLKKEVTDEGKTFFDIKDHEAKAEIEALASRGIITGKSEESFDPDTTMTRAEFAAIVVRALGLPEKLGTEFSDVDKNAWYYSFVNTARAYGIVNGVSSESFNPNGIITREEASVMVARAAKLCGMNTDIETLAARDILAGFFDYVKASDWAVISLAFCYSEGILSDEVMEIRPKEAVTRAEIAKMLYNLLDSAKLF